MTLFRRFRARLVEEDQDPAATFLLLQIAEQPALRVSDLAARSGLDTSTVSRHIRNLEEARLVTRSGDPDDRRASRLSMTRRGRAQLRRAIDLRIAIVGDAVAAWPARDKQALTALLTRLAADLGGPSAETESR